MHTQEKTIKWLQVLAKGGAMQSGGDGWIILLFLVLEGSSILGTSISLPSDEDQTLVVIMQVLIYSL